MQRSELVGGCKTKVFHDVCICVRIDRFLMVCKYRMCIYIYCVYIYIYYIGTILCLYIYYVNIYIYYV